MSDLVVHYLWHGLPLCRFTRELPGDWPPGHLWVSAAEDQPAVTCPRCIGDRQNARVR